MTMVESMNSLTLVDAQELPFAAGVLLVIDANTRVPLALDRTRSIGRAAISIMVRRGISGRDIECWICTDRSKIPAAWKQAEEVVRVAAGDA